MSEKAHSVQGLEIVPDETRAERRLKCLVGKHLELGPGITGELLGGLARLTHYSYAPGMQRHTLVLHGLWLEGSEQPGVVMEVGSRKVFWTTEQALTFLPALEDRILTADSYRAMVEPVLDLQSRFYGGLM
jgi:hypothetical protein